MSEYTVKIKELCDSLGAINVNIDDDEMVQIFLGGVSHKYGAFRTAITTREKPPRFIDLYSMLMMEENQLRPNSTMLDGQMLDTQGGPGHGRSCGNIGRNGRRSGWAPHYPRQVQGSNRGVVGLREGTHQPLTSNQNQ